MNLKICIWCKKVEPDVTFNKKAHTIPKSLGGEDICENVCDNCNLYFGSSHDNFPSIETVFKETFNVSRARFLAFHNNIGKNKTLSHFKSIYFQVDLKKLQIKLKPSFVLKPDFQNKLCHQFKKALFKVFLEETERQNANGLNQEFDFIRQFARYNKGDYPVYYFPRKHGIFLYTHQEIKTPKFYFFKRMDFHLHELNFFEFELLGHLFAIPISAYYTSHLNEYLIKTTLIKELYYYPPIELNYLSQIDLLLRIMED